MKKIINDESAKVAEIIRQGFNVRDDLLKEWSQAREKLSRVDWRKEFESFKNDPIDVAQNYITQIGDAFRNRTVNGEAKSDVDLEASAKKPRSPRPKAANTKQSTATSGTRRKATATRSKKASTTTRTRKVASKTAAPKAEDLAATTAE